MKIIELRAENVKRLRAVDITPDGTLQIVGGRNAQGKSSVLDAIWLALGGGRAAKETTLPIRDGESQGYDMTRGGEYGDMPHCCTECGTFGEYGVPWPCPTLRALGVES